MEKGVRVLMTAERTACFRTAVRYIGLGMEAEGLREAKEKESCDKKS